MEKYNSDDQGITLRNINEWFSCDGYECAIDNLEYKTLVEAKKVRSALNVIFNSKDRHRLMSEIIIVKEVGATKPKNITLNKPKDITPENISFVSDDELKKRIINGTLVDDKLETTLFPNGRPSK
jgi:hypothetical protein|tara:strand:- start:599 stop:973 length:375 start_codon:yes stop_codon:yes gene_type:complete